MTSKLKIAKIIYEADYLSPDQKLNLIREFKVSTGEKIARTVVGGATLGAVIVTPGLVADKLRVRKCKKIVAANTNLKTDEEKKKAFKKCYQDLMKNRMFSRKKDKK